MSDALIDSLRMQRQSDAEDALDRALIAYAINKTEENKAIVEKHTNALNDLSNDESCIQEYVDDFVANNSKAWKLLDRRQKARLFKSDPELYQQFLKIAETHGIAKLQLVIS